MIIKHITSAGCAYRIVESGEYIPFSSDPLVSDAGLNCLNGNKNNNYKHYGVIISFEWSGPVEKTDATTKLPKNCLIDNGSWRLFVPTKTNRYLKFHELEVMDIAAYKQFASDIVPWYFKLIRFNNWRTKAENKLDLFFANQKGKDIIVL